MEHEMDDWALLRDYSEGRSEAAFAELVQCHADLVYSSALRQPAARIASVKPYLSATASNATRQHSANAARNFSSGAPPSLAADGGKRRCEQPPPRRPLRGN